MGNRISGQRICITVRDGHDGKWQPIETHWFGTIKEAYKFCFDNFKTWTYFIEPNKHDRDKRGPILPFEGAFNMAVSSRLAATTSQPDYLILYYIKNDGVVSWCKSGSRILEDPDLSDGLVVFSVTLNVLTLGRD
jgi:hypothetical protein